MVSQKYRWDFIGLSTDTKPTAETSEKVVNGSTYYCSDTSKLYVYCDGTWYERKSLGGGGGTSNFNELTNRPKYNGTDMTGSTNIPEVQTYTQFTGTDGTSAGTSGLVPAPATTDAGKFLKADGTWESAGGGGGDTVYSTKTTSNSATGGSVYIGNLGADQAEVADPTSTDNHYKYFWALPAENNSIPKNNTINILGLIKGNATQNSGNTVIGSASVGESGNTLCNSNIAIGCGAFSSRCTVGSDGRAIYSVLIGSSASIPTGGNVVAIGSSATISSKSLDYGNVGIGANTKILDTVQSSIALGYKAQATRSGELNIGLSSGNVGFNNTLYRVIGGVHDGQELHDAATVAQGNTLATSAPTTSTVGVLGQLYTDTTNMHTYQCTAISGNTYTWTQRW